MHFYDDTCRLPFLDPNAKSNFKFKKMECWIFDCKYLSVMIMEARFYLEPI